jgi:glycogen debranching enzyme
MEVAWALGVGDGQEAADALARRTGALREAKAYAQWLSTRLETGDPLLQSMFVAGLNAAVAMFKEFPGDFAGLVAGAAYAYPPRLYFRDAYWTAQALLPFRPELVRRHLLSLARGVHADGQCPSAVFAPHVAQEWGVKGSDRLDWLPDHYDAPPFLVLLLADYVRATEDWAVLDEVVPVPQGRGEDAPGHYRPLWHTARAAVHYLMSRDQDGDGLVEKPHEANDWADNVRRSTWVCYDQALYAAVLKAAAEIAAHRGEEEGGALYGQTAEAATRALDAKLWEAGRGHFVNYRRPGFAENHFSIDTLVAALYGLTDDQQTRSMLAAAQNLQTRHNAQQPYGDWGIMSVFPPYQEPNDLFGKSADPYRYHNGADWPYWDGVYGLILKRAGDPDWCYVLTRWWEYSLAQGWLTPVEYYSPPFPPGGMLQGWSAMPAAALAE